MNRAATYTAPSPKGERHGPLPVTLPGLLHGLFARSRGTIGNDDLRALLSLTGEAGAAVATVKQACTELAMLVDTMAARGLSVEPGLLVGTLHALASMANEAEAKLALVEAAEDEVRNRERQRLGAVVPR